MEWSWNDKRPGNDGRPIPFEQKLILSRIHEKDQESRFLFRRLRSVRKYRDDQKYMNTLSRLLSSFASVFSRYLVSPFSMATWPLRVYEHMCFWLLLRSAGRSSAWRVSRKNVWKLSQTKCFVGLLMKLNCRKLMFNLLTCNTYTRMHTP